MKPKDQRTLEERAQDLEKVLTFSIVSTAKKFYASVEALKIEFNHIISRCASRKTEVEFHRRFKHTQQEYRKIIGKGIHIDQILPLMSKWIHLQKNFSYNYRSGKSFHVHSYWYIDFNVLERLWNRKDVADASSSYYTQKQHKLIDNVILGYCSKTSKSRSKRKVDGYCVKQHELENSIGKIETQTQATRDQVTDLTVEMARLMQENSELKRDIEELKNNMSLQRSALASPASIQTNHRMTSFPINNSQKVINAALDFYNAPEEAKEVILSKKLVPTDDSFRFYAARDNDGNTIVLDATRNKTCKVSPSGCFKVGASQIPYYLNVETVNKFKCKFSDMYFYANRFLTGIWKSKKNAFFQMQKNLHETLGFKPTRDFK